MTGGPMPPGAPSALTDWKAVDWPSVHQRVERLQMRIAKAEKEKRAGRFKALQRRPGTRRSSCVDRRRRRDRPRKGSTSTGETQVVTPAGAYT